MSVCVCIRSVHTCELLCYLLSLSFSLSLSLSPFSHANTKAACNLPSMFY